MKLKKNEIWKVDGRKGPLTIKLLENIDTKVDDFFEAEVMTGRVHYLSDSNNAAQRADGQGLEGGTISMRTTLVNFITRENLLKQPKKKGKIENVPTSLFGKDHWSLLAYVETVVVEGEVIKHERLRCNEAYHPMMKRDRFGTQGGWQMAWGTRIVDGKVLPQHDDWDCLEDLAAAGYLQIESMTEGSVTLTPTGLAKAHELRAHKIAGGTFATFAGDSNGR